MNIDNAMPRCRHTCAALGLIIGEFVQVGLWLVVSVATATIEHSVFPVWTPFYAGSRRETRRRPIGHLSTGRFWFVDHGLGEALMHS